MKNKLITSVLSVPVAYLFWQVAGEFFLDHSDHGFSSLADVVKFELIWLIVSALACAALNGYIFIAALKAKGQGYAKLTAVYSGLSTLASLSPIALVVWTSLQSHGG